MDGEVIGHEGSWMSGVNGARYGLIMPGKPEVGYCYCQELARRVALDRAEIVSFGNTVRVPAGTFYDCLRIRESSDLEKGTQDKLYAPGVGLLNDGQFKLTKTEPSAQ